MDIATQKLAGLVRRVVNKLVFIEKKSVFRFGEVKLFPSEIHLMQLINQEKGLNATEMAGRLGVSKGAVSQTLSRLVQKGVIQKKQDSPYKNELTVAFTPMGREAIGLFEERQAENRRPYAAYLAGLSADEKKVIEEFLTQTERVIDKLE